MSEVRFLGLGASESRRGGGVPLPVGEGLERELCPLRTKILNIYCLNCAFCSISGRIYNGSIEMCVLLLLGLLLLY